MVRIRGQIRRLPLGLEATAGLRPKEGEKKWLVGAFFFCFSTQKQGAFYLTFHFG